MKDSYSFFSCIQCIYFSTKITSNFMSVVGAHFCQCSSIGKEEYGTSDSSSIVLNNKSSQYDYQFVHVSTCNLVLGLLDIKLLNVLVK